MAKKLRSVNTYFWDDSFVQGLSPNSKLLFLYLLTNSLTNVLGIYEITLKRIVFDTGLTELSISKSFEDFGRLKKVYFIDNYIVLPNFLKNQSMNNNMKTGAVNVYNELPKKITELSDYEHEVKDFESLLKALESFENSNINIKFNINRVEPKKINPSLDDIKKYFKENNYTEKSAIKFFKYYDAGKWKDSKGNAVINWKQKAQSVWFKEENEVKEKALNQLEIAAKKTEQKYG